MTLLSNRQQGLKAYPDTLKHFWTCEEGTGATSLTDVVAGANITVNAVTSASGKLTIPFGVSLPTDAPLTAPGSSPFMFCFSATVPFATAVRYGGDTSHYAAIGGFTSAASEVKGTSLAVGTAESDQVGEATYSLIYDGTNIALYTEGTIVTGTNAYNGGALTDISPEFDIVAADLSDCSGIAFFVFPGGLPSNYAAAAHYMMTEWALGNKIVPDEFRV